MAHHEEGLVMMRTADSTLVTDMARGIEMGAAWARASGASAEVLREAAGRLHELTADGFQAGIASGYQLVAAMLEDGVD